MGKWIERPPDPGETVRFIYSDTIGQYTQKKIGIYLRRGPGSAQTFWIVDIGTLKLWIDEYATFEVWQP